MTRLSIAILSLTLFWACGGTHHESAPSEATHDPANQAEPSEDLAWMELLPNARRPADGVVSGGQPSPEQFEAASAAGYKTVINLRMPGESGIDGEAELVEGLGMSYVALPIDGADGLSEENARALSAALEDSERPLLLHCGSGNRVGALLALSAYYVEGMSSDAALEYGLKSGMTRLEKVVRRHLASASEES